MSDEETLNSAIKNGDVDAVRGIIAAHPELIQPADAPVSPLMLSMYYRQAAVTQAILESGIILTLHEAAASGSTARLIEILDTQPDAINTLSPDGFPPLGLACFFDHFDSVEVLLQRGADVNQPAQNAQKVAAIHAAVAARSLPITRLLIEHGADVNAKQQQDVTPLHAAAHNGSLEIVQLLLEHGADKNATDASGKSALDFARESGFDAIVEILES